ncbi:hypothetical protein Mal64_17820 [Pseudobythopirellula maris]|uniref:Uncharacterized protein n=1 Tax=Pseudobythopirellula maris TaxID=2527991 RepID=A0A5C5ZPJ3_9BACT|nr:hypothetical protein [Pseudobythopirellula maris]TWT88303.1 hypothetical protein Mal64_17820 [Pseudobythopirellula maris]
MSKSRWRAPLIALAIVASFVLLAEMVLGGRGRMTSAVSPDGRYRITLDEGSNFIDRNFDLLIWDRQTSSETRFQYLHDQSPLIKREHFVWSPDSRMAALVGDRYFTIPEAELPSGDLICLVYDVQENLLYDNYDHAEPSADRVPAERAKELFGNAILEPAPPIE